MKTFLECVPCFFRQAVSVAKLSGADEAAQKKIIFTLGKKLPEFSFSLSPPELSRTIYRISEEVTGVTDPYLPVNSPAPRAQGVRRLQIMKRKSNAAVMKIYPAARESVENAEDSLLAATEFAIAGNIIDCGTANPFDVNLEIEKIIKEEEKTRKRKKKTFDYEIFREEIIRSDRILYLGDNTGEIVFDRILIEEIRKLGGKKKVFFVVKERPVINDAIVQDALFCGLDKCASVISSGSDAPGTVPSLCSREFFNILDSSQMVISKGQGNFEAFNPPEGKPSFFLFMAKCPVVTSEAGCGEGDINLIGKNP